MACKAAGLSANGLKDVLVKLREDFFARGTGPPCQQGGPGAPSPVEAAPSVG